MMATRELTEEEAKQAAAMKITIEGDPMKFRLRAELHGDNGMEKAVIHKNSVSQLAHAVKSLIDAGALQVTIDVAPDDDIPMVNTKLDWTG